MPVRDLPESRKDSHATLQTQLSRLASLPSRVPCVSRKRAILLSGNIKHKGMPMNPRTQKPHAHDLKRLSVPRVDAEGARPRI